MDSLQVLNEFGTQVANALNTAKVEPREGHLCAVLLIVGCDSDPAPLGGSLNYDKKTGGWEVAPQVEYSQKLEFED